MAKGAERKLQNRGGGEGRFMESYSRLSLRHSDKNRDARHRGFPDRVKLRLPAGPVRIGSSMHRIRNSWREPLVCLVLAAATLAVFWPLSHHDFIVFDDGDYVSRNAVVQRGLTVQGLGWAFTTAHASN